MDVVRGACSKDKVGGMVYIREDIAPSMLEWKAIDDDKNSISIPLNTLVNLQATKETVPKMILQISYKSDDGANEPDKKLKLHFNNRPTMNNIKDALQAIVVRSRTRVEGSSSPTPAPNKEVGANSSATFSSAQSNLPSTPSSSSSSSLSSSSYSSSSSTAAAAGAGATVSSSASFSGFPQALSDADLLKDFQLQQRLLLEDRNLRNTFTKSVMNFKLSPTIFWSSRINQLRTFAITVSQHRGPYNVLSTIKPVATSDNQVNVNVTRDTINEIFEIYPIIKKAFTDLVPHKLSEGEFWSRFFNSRLFRRLRGDKIGLNSGRGDVVLDKYLYMDEKSLTRTKPSQNHEEKRAPENGSNSPKRQKLANDTEDVSKNDNPRIEKFLDLFGNEQDNSQKLGNRPDMTMRYENDNDDDDVSKLQSSKRSSGRENEMIILMRNMNKLSSKMMTMSSSDGGRDSFSDGVQGEKTVDGLSAAEVNEYEEELNLHDLNEVEDAHYIRLNINTNNVQTANIENDTSKEEENQVSNEELMSFAQEQFQKLAHEGIFDLTDTFRGKSHEIEETSAKMSLLIRQNFKTFKLLNKDDLSISSTAAAFGKQPQNIIPEKLVQEIISYNITVVEFLSHFWKLFLQGKNPQQLKKIFTSLKNCSNSIKEFKKRAISQLESIDLVSRNEKLKEKVTKDFYSCLEPMEVSLENALTKYTEAIQSSNGN
ncbi:TFB1 [Candida oxycetoniae]|uniref:TFB1 n=1 Tax=Candida oxycetoniae TaxID=497107 RepID=A0AAI9T0N9_9ASCO|nr:TFB1 [Candida oxycetoniae]KAI3406696.2 TFB1 [Candida oxycetoniae]